MFDLSYERLNDDEKKSFVQLGCFRGPFSSTAVGFLWGGNRITVNKHLQHLQRFGLVELWQDPFYRLHPLLRIYTRQKLDTYPELRASTYERHAQYYLEQGFGEQPAPFISILNLLIKHLPQFGNDSTQIRRIFEKDSDHTVTDRLQGWKLLIELMDRTRYDEQVNQYLRKVIKESLEERWQNKQIRIPFDSSFLFSAKSKGGGITEAGREIVVLDILEAVLWFRENAPRGLLSIIGKWAKREFSEGRMSASDYEGLTKEISEYYFRFGAKAVEISSDIASVVEVTPADPATVVTRLISDASSNLSMLAEWLMQNEFYIDPDLQYSSGFFQSIKLSKEDLIELKKGPINRANNKTDQ